MQCLYSGTIKEFQLMIKHQNKQKKDLSDFIGATWPDLTIFETADHLQIVQDETLYERQVCGC